MNQPTLSKRLRMAGALLFGGSPWDGANASPNRSRTLGGAPVDFKQELTSYTREELVRNMRSLRKNNGLVREFINSIALYSAPVTPQAQTDSHDWNSEAEDYYRRARQKADVTFRFSGAELQRLASKSLDTDGEIFFLKVFDKVRGLPLLQAIETHRVGDFGGRKDLVDGMKLNNYGRPVAANVLLDNGKTRMIPMGQLMHVFDPESTSAVRHTPTLAHAINHQIDADELLAIEKKGVKDLLDKTVVWKMLGGDMGDDEFGELFGEDAAGDYIDELERTDPQAAAKIIGGKNILAQVGEDVEVFEPNRPTSTFVGFLEHLDRNSALGGLPYEFFVNPSGLNAGAIRLLTSRVERIANRRSEVLLDRFLRPDWFFVIGTAIDNGELAPIKNWNRIKGGYPKSVNVDAGRNEESLRRNIEMGLATPSDAYAEKGEDFATAMERKATDLKVLEAIAKKYELDPDQLFKLAKDKPAPPQGIAGTAPSAPDPDKKKNEKDDDKKK